MAQRGVLTEIGPDVESLREQDRGAVLFDLGLKAWQVDACIRVSDSATIAKLRTLTGCNVFESGNPVMQIVIPASPHRVFLSRIGRVEVFQPIPPPHGRSPEGPHTHVLPKLIAQARTHAATERIPEGLVPCAHFYPPHPVRNGLGQPLPFDEGRHAAFQKMLSRFGDRNLLETKSRMIDAVLNGDDPSAFELPDDRFSRMAARVALRQLKAKYALRSWTGAARIDAWIDAFDRSRSGEAADDAAGDDPHS